VVDESYKDDNYNEQIEKYFARLDQIQAKADIAELLSRLTFLSLLWPSSNIKVNLHVSCCVHFSALGSSWVGLKFSL